MTRDYAIALAVPAARRTGREPAVRSAALPSYLWRQGLVAAGSA